MIEFKTTSIFNIKARPYELLEFFGFSMGVLSFFPIHGDAFDINFNDTYYVVDNLSFCRIFAMLLLFLWLIYLVTNKLMQSKYLTWLHVIFSVIPIVFFFVGKWHLSAMPPPPGRYYAFTDLDYQRRLFYGLAWLYATVFILFVLGQLCLLINVIGGLVKSLKKRKRTI